MTENLWERFPAEFLGLLKPEHWHGHTIGQGETTPRPRISYDPAAFNFARGSINGFLGQGVGMPIEVARKLAIAHSFRAPDEEPGTIVAYTKEVLHGTHPVDDELLQILAKIAMPEWPQPVGFANIDKADVNRCPPSFAGGGRSYSYRRGLFLGAVAEYGKESGNELISVAVRSVGDVLRGSTGTFVEITPTLVGETVHFDDGDGEFDGELIQRVTAMEVAAPLQA